MSTTKLSATAVRCNRPQQRYNNKQNNEQQANKTMNNKQTNNLRRRVEKVITGVLRQANGMIAAGKSVHKYKEVLFKEWMDSEIRKKLLGLPPLKNREVVFDNERGVVQVYYLAKEPYTPEEQYTVVRSLFNTKYFNAVRPLFTAVRGKYIGGNVNDSAYDMVMSGEMEKLIDNIFKQFELE